jgi:hypothetical protein
MPPRRGLCLCVVNHTHRPQQSRRPVGHHRHQPDRKSVCSSRSLRRCIYRVPHPGDRSTRRTPRILCPSRFSDSGQLRHATGLKINWSHPLGYSDYKCFRFGFDSGIAFVSIDHPPINLLDEVLSQEFDRLGRELEADEGVRVVVLQSALANFFIAHSGLARVGSASKIVPLRAAFALPSRSASGSGTCPR